MASTFAGKEEVSSSSDISRRQKYRGLLKRSNSKIFRDNLFTFLDYLYTMAPSHQLGVQIMRWVHFLQILLMATFPNNIILFPAGKLLSRIFQVLSIISYISPVQTTPLAHIVIEYIVYILFAGFLIFLFVCLKFFLKYTKISNTSIKILSWIFNAYLPYLITFTSSNIGYDLYLIIKHEYYTATVFSFIIGIIELILMVSFQLIFVTPSLTFRPQAVHIISTQISVIYFVFVVFFAFATTFGSLIDGIARLIFMFTSIIPCGFLLYSLYFRAEVWGTRSFHVMTLAFVQTITVMIVVLPTVSYVGKSVNEIELFCFAVLFYLIYYIFPLFLESSAKRDLLILDKISENEEFLENISNRRFLQLLRTGFDSGHKICHTWKLFKMANDKVLRDKTYLIIFARYAAIYPDESTVLHSVNRLIRNVKRHNIEMKYLSFQITNLLQQRERSLSKSIKKACTKIADKTDKCRNQLRMIWEAVICGVTADLENMTTNLKKNEDEITREYSQLCLVYPNNQYVASAYAAYLSDILCKDKEASTYVQIYRRLRSGARTRIERSYYFAIHHIKSLPSDIQHADMNDDSVKQPVNDNKSVASIASMAMGNDAFDLSEDKSQQRYMESMIESVRLPSLRYGPIVLFFSLSVIIPVLSIPLLLLIIRNLSSDTSCIFMMELFTMIRTYLMQITMTSYYYALSKLNVVLPLSTVLNSEGEKTDDDIFFQPVNDARAALNEFNILFSNFSTNGYFSEPYKILFSPINSLSLFATMNESTLINWSYQHISSFYGLTAIELSKKKGYQMSKFPELRTIVENSLTVDLHGNIIVESLLNSHMAMMDGFYSLLLIYVVGIGLATLIVCLSLTAFVFWRLRKEKSMIYKSFKALPKSTVSAIVSRLDAQSGKHNGQETTIPLTMQEENAMRILSISTDNSSRANSKIISIWILIFMAVISMIAGLTIIVLKQKDINDSFPSMNVVIFDLTQVQTTFYNIFLAILRIASAKNQQNNFIPENITELFETTTTLLVKQINHLHRLRFGHFTNTSHGISTIGNAIINLLATTPQYTTRLPKSYNDILNSCSLENELLFIFDLEAEVVNYIQYIEDDFDLNSEKIQLILRFLLTKGNETFLIHGLELIDEAILSTAYHIQVYQIIIPIVVLDVIIVICGILIIPKFISIGEQAQWTMRLLLFCPANVVFQSHKITKILSNDFSMNENEEIEESSHFYESIVSHISDPVIFATTDMKIYSINEAFYDLFKKDIDELRGTHLAKFISSFSSGKELSVRNIIAILDNINKSSTSPSFESDLELSIDGEEYSFRFSLHAINKNGEIQTEIVPIEYISMHTIVLTNLTVQSRYNRQAAEERNYIEKLLAVFMPEPVISRVINKESNICFVVPSISVVMIDIVGFSSYCTNNPSPSKALETLDKIYAEFDKLLTKYDEMMKITSLGDTYMAAGGVFDEVNQPQIHAKQAISFGIDTINLLDLINIEAVSNLKIRVGVNTGGPIIAGVLSIEKPTFELLGPPIAIAMEMEKTGTPMQVHIPQIVYDLVYGSQFVIKEAGLIGFKETLIQSYLVSGYDKDI
ncbi:hypothetical protein TRFO_32106 [Tritrichomonas foetus]|uniref:adenylate cyclase n=1 Tax=Tritrichomonas foetus TaxID=1144522 RepID=A0A1J4JR00_9EUKA|nr:hypothetical protein TRFO_32106 [Tritrichomonas foetus]|eukprot:OHT01170.1 hypothetical protein TRFO_32106 [Tritrichomonas foetus]